MTLTDWDEDDIFQRKMYDGIFQNGLSEFAGMTTFAMQEVWRYYGGAGQSRYYFETYVTLGDPSMRLRTWVTRSVKALGCLLKFRTERGKFPISLSMRTRSPSGAPAWR